jgi:hypothetical protein
MVRLFLPFISWVCAFSILDRKHRGMGYYTLTVLCPIVGLIVAACLKSKPLTRQDSIVEENSNDTSLRENIRENVGIALLLEALLLSLFPSL